MMHIRRHCLIAPMWPTRALPLLFLTASMRVLMFLDHLPIFLDLLLISLVHELLPLLDMFLIGLLLPQGTFHLHLFLELIGSLSLPMLPLLRLLSTLNGRSTKQ